jgi:hypothetical protein
LQFLYLTIQDGKALGSLLEVEQGCQMLMGVEEFCLRPTIEARMKQKSVSYLMLMMMLMMMMMMILMLL